jgi:thioredoxin 1
MNHLDSKSYEEAINAAEKCVVDFYATWCGPCKAMNPILEKIESEMGEGKIFKVNVDEHRDLVEKFGIRSVPTFIFYEKGEEKGRKSGMIDKNYLVESLTVQSILTD